MSERRPSPNPGRAGDGEPVVVCVVGTPRSATSLTAQILSLAGVYFGPEADMRPATAWNPRGFWEARELIALNRRLLDSLQREGLTPPRLPPGWATSEALESEREDARRWLRETFDGHDPWGWKYAGATLVLPFWQQLIPQMRYVVCTRNPLDIAASVKSHRAKSKASAEEFAAVWPKHIATALAYTAGRPRVLVSYDDYLHDRRRTIKRLWRFVHGTPPSEPDTQRLEAAVEDDLLHHRTSPAKTLRDGILPLEANSMFLILELLREAERRTGEPSGGSSALEETVNAYARRLLER
jgi:hypothetical protein